MPTHFVLPTAVKFYCLQCATSPYIRLFESIKLRMWVPCTRGKNMGSLCSNVSLTTKRKRDKKMCVSRRCKHRYTSKVLLWRHSSMANICSETAIYSQHYSALCLYSVNLLISLSNKTQNVIGAWFTLISVLWTCVITKITQQSSGETDESVDGFEKSRLVVSLPSWRILGSSDYFFKLCSLFVMLFSTVTNMRK